jgi:hypothetical protein
MKYIIEILNNIKITEELEQICYDYDLNLFEEYSQNELLTLCERDEAFEIWSNEGIN